MKRILKVILFVFFVVTAIYLYDLVTIDLMNKNFKISYGKGLEYKFDKLAAIESNKIVIVGGSNVSFGIDSDIIERELEIPTVNMGLHASFYTYVIIEPVLPYLKNGDVLIISREFAEKTIYGSSLEVANYFSFMPIRAKKEVYKNFDAIAPVLKHQILNSQKNVLEYEFEKQLTYKSGPYSFNAFRNDNLLDKEINFEMSKGQYSDIQVSPLGLVSNLEVLDYYTELYEKLTDRGISVYFSLPSIVDSQYSETDMVNYYEKLSADTGIPLLSNRTYAFPRNKMSNSIYHLNKDGRATRSYEIAKDFSKIKGITPNNTKVKKKYIVGKNDSENSKARKITINNCLLGIYDTKNNSLTFKATNPEKTSNYYRIREKGDGFNGRSFKVIIEGNKDVLKDIKFRAIGRIEEWDEVNIINDAKWEFIKNNVLNTYYKDDHSYIGIAIDNVLKHNDVKVKVISMEISDVPFSIYEESFVLKQNKKYMISVKQTFNTNIIEGIKFSPEMNKKYIISYDENFLKITDLYAGETEEIKRNNTNELTIKGGKTKIEIHEL